MPKTIKKSSKVVKTLKRGKYGKRTTKAKTGTRTKTKKA